MEEIWKDIPGSEGIYQISSLGRVRRDGKIRRPQVVKNGYVVVSLYNKAKHETKYVHRLVLATFIGPCPKGMEVCHNDSNRQNNALSNLRYDTKSGNRKDAITLGRSARQRLTVQNVLELREKYGHLDHVPNVEEVAKQYGVARHAITNAIRGRTFSCVN